MVASFSMLKESNMIGLHFWRGTAWTIDVPLFYEGFAWFVNTKRKKRVLSRASPNDIFPPQKHKVKVSSHTLLVSV